MGTPSQPEHDELSPSHTPQSSTTAEPPYTPLQSAGQSLLESESQVPQLSVVAVPPQSPLQSWDVTTPSELTTLEPESAIIVANSNELTYDTKAKPRLSKVDSEIQ